MASSNSSSALCPTPFLPLDAFPTTGGVSPPASVQVNPKQRVLTPTGAQYLKGRFCGPVTPDQTCCLPCPLQQWVSSDDFERNAAVAYWFNVPAFACQIFLLVTFAVLPKEVSGRHYLSVGLCVALMMLEISFIIPLSARPEQCYNEITPRDMYSSMSCAWSGALLEMGSMAAVVWILLRSLWTHLRVCWDMQHTSICIWLAHAFGWGLPALFLAISLPVTGVSFRVGGTCLPNPKGAFVTWYGWLVAFGCLGALIQFGTTGFCLAAYIKNVFRPGEQSMSTTTGTSTMSAASGNNKDPGSRKMGKRLAWRRVRKVMAMQWRSVLLSLFVIVETIYFGVVYAAQVANAKNSAKPEHSEDIYQWTLCLIQTGGDKDRCLYLAKALSVPEPTVIASFFMVSVIGIFTFLLMVRHSMLVGWWELILNPRGTRRRQSSADEWVSAKPKRLSLGRILGSDRLPPTTAGGEDEIPMPKGVLPSPEEERKMSVPEAGDVAKRHETTTLFDDEGDEEDVRKLTKVERLSGDGDVV